MQAKVGDSDLRLLGGIIESFVGGISVPGHCLPGKCREWSVTRILTIGTGINGYRYGHF
jgi:hypothetical protein